MVRIPNESFNDLLDLPIVHWTCLAMQDFFTMLVINESIDEDMIEACGRRKRKESGQLILYFKQCKLQDR